MTTKKEFDCVESALSIKEEIAKETSKFDSSQLLAYWKDITKKNPSCKKLKKLDSSSAFKTVGR